MWFGETWGCIDGGLNLGTCIWLRGLSGDMSDCLPGQCPGACPGACPWACPGTFPGAC